MKRASLSRSIKGVTSIEDDSSFCATSANSFANMTCRLESSALSRVMRTGGGFTNKETYEIHRKVNSLQSLGGRACSPTLLVEIVCLFVEVGKLLRGAQAEAAVLSQYVLHVTVLATELAALCR
eukprot:m.15352 g.15352  ORF g.15352 m.15352 type:complete len:124 (-) comp3430_c0_seq1:66-437(-)